MHRIRKGQFKLDKLRGEELAELAGRLKAAGEVTRDQEATTCCYAQSDKAWVNDPWPSLGDLPHLW